MSKNSGWKFGHGMMANDKGLEKWSRGVGIKDLEVTWNSRKVIVMKKVEDQSPDRKKEESAVKMDETKEKEETKMCRSAEIVDMTTSPAQGASTDRSSGEM